MIFALYIEFPFWLQSLGDTGDLKITVGEKKSIVDSVWAEKTGKIEKSFSLC